MKASTSACFVLMLSSILSALATRDLEDGSTAELEGPKRGLLATSYYYGYHNFVEPKAAAAAAAASGGNAAAAAAEAVAGGSDGYYRHGHGHAAAAAFAAAESDGYDRGYGHRYNPQWRRGYYGDEHGNYIRDGASASTAAVAG